MMKRIDEAISRSIEYRMMGKEDITATVYVANIDMVDIEDIIASIEAKYKCIVDCLRCDLCDQNYTVYGKIYELWNLTGEDFKIEIREDF